MFVRIPTLAERKLIQPRAGVGGVQIGTRCNKAHTDKVRVGFIGAGGGIRIIHRVYQYVFLHSFYPQKRRNTAVFRGFVVLCII